LGLSAGRGPAGRYGNPFSIWRALEFSQVVGLYIATLFLMVADHNLLCVFFATADASHSGVCVLIVTAADCILLENCSERL